MHVLMLLVCVLFVSLCLIEQQPYEPVLYFQSLTVHSINRPGSDAAVRHAILPVPARKQQTLPDVDGHV